MKSVYCQSGCVYTTSLITKQESLKEKKRFFVWEKKEQRTIYTRIYNIYWYYTPLQNRTSSNSNTRPKVSTFLCYRACNRRPLHLSLRVSNHTSIIFKRSAHSFATGPVIEDPFISPLGLVITPALSS